MSKFRFTVEILASGQPRPYADTIRHVRVTFEHVPWDSKSGELEPDFMGEEAARRWLAGIPCAGFVGTARNGLDWKWPETYLAWLKPIDGKPASEIIPHGDPNQICAAVWEFQTNSPFTD